MPSFLSLKDLRRRSRASFGTSSTDRSSDSSNGTGNGTNESLPGLKSSSAATSSYGGNTPPALTISHSASNLESLTNGIPIGIPDSIPNSTPPPNPNGRPTVSKRLSVGGMSGLGSLGPNSTLPGSLYSPRITSIAEGAWVSLCPSTPNSEY